jgi:hypothetical protein
VIVADVADPAVHQSAVGKWRLGSSVDISQAERHGCSTIKSRNRWRHGRRSSRTYRARLRAAFIGPEMSRRRATASAKYRPSLTALPSTGACHFKQWATVSRAPRLDVRGRQPFNPRALCVVGASTDASVLLHRARDQAAGAASLAPSCHPEPRYSRCGYPCDPMWLRMRARLLSREQHQTRLPLCDAHSWTSLQGQERQRQPGAIIITTGSRPKPV